MYDPLIVLHETISPGDKVIANLQNNNTSSSYHVLISRDGTINYLVNSRNKASAGYNCSFNGEQVDNSVDDFSYHVVLESPPDIDLDNDYHTGYTESQYYSLGYLISKTNVPTTRIVTHAEIDLSKKSKDPYKFDKEYFFNVLAKFPKTKEIYFGIAGY
ncbi:N-acetylmuramoyl-L-alanine amidase [Calothrix sp. FACHB-1219]|uniref:N-acetylmuramoyl-L-alanine amidase n=1 Tax=unclassified Calothrix TaxID=2619626 RepID=UPI00168609C5|nr:MULTISPECIES: N-acetylmuramoyl-L-alanine amidase [unclassified Calothrix]MBD2201544.1 N-acetylmuramoyl-L-alanine amidase [Calothrix sp. FACHB-168]MBD2217230.1 N-acetylmuramoyl-L-alanine amidase [Calothrix sp. FACHB-1219]